MAGTLDPHPGALVLLPECDQAAVTPGAPIQPNSELSITAAALLARSPRPPQMPSVVRSLIRGLEQFLFLTTAALVKLLPVVLGCPVQG